MQTTRAAVVLCLLTTACGAPMLTPDGGLPDSGIGGPGGSYSIGGQVTGLTGSGLVLQNKSGNSEDQVAIDANGSFVFAKTLSAGATYLVTVKAQPSNQECAISSGAGVVGNANVTGVTVTCGPPSGLFTIGGTVSGLSGVVELANGSEKLLVAMDGAFFFPTAVPSGTAYAVTVSTQPDTVSCAVSGGSGTVGGANVTDIQVTCGVSLTDKVMVLRVGTGGSALSNVATEVFVDEYQLSDGAKLRTISLPGVTLSGTATSEGSLSRSTNLKYVTLAGYSAAVGTADIAGTQSATIPRVAARIDAAGAVDSSTFLNLGFNQDNVRGCVTVDGSSYWVSGDGLAGSGGVHHVTAGSTGASTQVVSSPGNTRWANIFADQLYVSASTAGNQGVLQVGTGVPTASAAATQLPGLPTSSFPAYGFALFDLDPAEPGLDTLYVAVDAAPAAGTLNVQKWRLTAGTWGHLSAFAPTSPVGASFTLGARGLAAAAGGQGITLVATTAEPTPRLVRFVDDQNNSTPEVTVVVSAGSNTAFRGVAFSPIP